MLVQLFIYSFIYYFTSALLYLSAFESLSCFLNFLEAYGQVRRVFVLWHRLAVFRNIYLCNIAFNCCLLDPDTGHDILCV